MNTKTIPVFLKGVWQDLVLHQDKLKDGTLAPKMIWLPSGQFTMGTHRYNTEDESPVHEVNIAYPFAMGMYQVTFDEYDFFCKATGREEPSDNGWGRGKRPVINVTWYDAKAYCQWLSNQTGKKYRLPSEAEWEYACRAGSSITYEWCFGDNHHVLVEHAWYSKNSAGRTHPVGEKEPNKFGLHDMHGNVLEWCEDEWHSDYKGAPTDGSAWVSKKSGMRILRGGSWYDHNHNFLRCAYRYGFTAKGSGFNNFGFRVVCEAEYYIK